MRVDWRAGPSPRTLAALLPSRAPARIAAAVAALLVSATLVPVYGQPAREPEVVSEPQAVPPGGPEDGAGPAVPDEPSPSQSIAATNNGRLIAGVPLEASDSIFVRNESNRYGTQELVDVIAWAAGQVDEQTPGSRLVVGDLSRQRGRRLRPHRSHRAGRDADIGFYLVDADGVPAANERFVRLRANGVGQERRGERRSLKWDNERNWQFIAALMGQDAVPIQYIMVISPLKERLLEEGVRQGAPEWLLHRVREAVGPRRSGRGRHARYGTHNSHFHVRIYCDYNDRPRCQDKPPYWDWIHRPPPPSPPPRARRRRASRMRASRMRSSRMRSSRMQSVSMRATRMR